METPNEFATHLIIKRFRLQICQASYGRTLQHSTSHEVKQWNVEREQIRVFECLWWSLHAIFINKSWGFWWGFWCFMVLISAAYELHLSCVCRFPAGCWARCFQCERAWRLAPVETPPWWTELGGGPASCGPLEDLVKLVLASGKHTQKLWEFMVV